MKSKTDSKLSAELMFEYACAIAWNRLMQDAFGAKSQSQVNPDAERDVPRSAS